MARVNVEDAWFVDAEEKRECLIQAIQALPIRWSDAADGMAVRAWKLAQRFWKDGEKLIPEADWKRAGLEPLIVCDLAERRPEGVYVRGTRDQHDWILQRVEAGKRGGNNRAKTAERGPTGRFEKRPDGHQTTAGEIQTATRRDTRRPLENVQTATRPPAPAPAPALASTKLEAERAKALSPVKRTRKSDPPLDPSDLAVGREWLAFALEECPWKFDDPSWTPERFGQSIAKVKAAVGLNEEGAAALLAFVRTDDFWRKNALSPAGLLKKSGRNDQRKIDNILIRMRSKTDRTVSAVMRWAEGKD